MAPRPGFFFGGAAAGDQLMVRGLAFQPSADFVKAITLSSPAVSNGVEARDFRFSQDANGDYSFQFGIFGGMIDHSVPATWTIEFVRYSPGARF